jgi:hypothetical protein
MPNHSPHFIITGALAGLFHYAQVGIELVKMLLGAEIPTLGLLSAVAVNVSVAIFAVRIALLACRAVLAAAALVGRLEDECVRWGQRKLVELANWMLARLNQNGPHA